MNEKTNPAQPGAQQGTQPHNTQDNKSKTAPVNPPGGQPVNPATPQGAETPKA
jgi:hypothetical protein